MSDRKHEIPPFRTNSAKSETDRSNLAPTGSKKLIRVKREGRKDDSDETKRSFRFRLLAHGDAASVGRSASFRLNEIN